MLNLFERFDTPSRDLLRSQHIANIKIPTVVMEDDGFLPDELDSPFKYFSKLRKNHQPLYFDQIPVPKYWRILGNGNRAEIFDLDCKRAEVIYMATDNTRIVKEVQWLNNANDISWIDHYNKNGFKFAQTLYSKGQPVTKKYFNGQGATVITWNLVAGDLFLDDKHIHHHFADFIDFMIFYLHERHYKLDRIFYNTLNKALNLSLRLSEPGEDTLFWYEKIDQELPGNMTFLMQHKTRTKHIVFQRFDDWQRHNQLIPADTGEVDFQYLGMIYPHPRSNHLRPNALVITNSDQIEQLGELANLMPNVHINIAAITEMSDKLSAFQDYPNIDLYPTVSGTRLQELLKISDVYLDINQGNEILDAVRGAFEQNMLILSFSDVLHNGIFTANSNVFVNGDARGMAKQILTALVQPQLMKKLIDTQRLEASDVTVGDYQRTFRKLMGENNE